MHCPSLLLTHTQPLSLCLLFLWFPARGPILTASVPRLAARPWPLLANGAERMFRISKGEKEVQGVRMHLRNQCELETDREKQESPFLLSTFPNPESTLLRAFELCKDQKRCWNLSFLLHCASSGMYNDKCPPSSLSLFSFYHLFIFSRKSSGLPKREGFTQVIHLFQAKPAEYSERR